MPVLWLVIPWIASAVYSGVLAVDATSLPGWSAELLQTGMTLVVASGDILLLLLTTGWMAIATPHRVSRPGLVLAGVVLALVVAAIRLVDGSVDHRAQWIAFAPIVVTLGAMHSIVVTHMRAREPGIGAGAV